MAHIGAVKKGQLDGAADTVVGAKRGAFSTKPLSVYIGLDGVVVEVDLHVHQLVAYHVHVALQHHSLAVFVTRGGSLAYQHVAGLVYQRLQAALAAETGQIVYHLFLTLRGTGNGVDTGKLLEYTLGGQFCIFHCRYFWVIG